VANVCRVARPRSAAILDVTQSDTTPTRVCRRRLCVLDHSRCPRASVGHRWTVPECEHQDDSAGL